LWLWQFILSLGAKTVRMASAVLRGARNPHVLLCTFRFLCSVRLASIHSHSFLEFEKKGVFLWQLH
jgi:hypothetical protein